MTYGTDNCRLALARSVDKLILFAYALLCLKV